MTEAASPEHSPNPMRPPKRRKVEEDDNPPFQNGDPHSIDRNPGATTTASRDSPSGTDEEKPTLPAKSDQPVVRGPQVLGSLDEVRPPRRSDTEKHSSSSHHDRHDSYSTTSKPVSSVPGTNLDPAVDAVLGKIFASGLFERKDIDGRALDFLASVQSQLALAALEDIQTRDFSTVRNKPAFIMSIFKRVIAGGGNAAPPQAPPPGGYTPTSVPPSALAHLSPVVSEALQRVFASGVCHPSQFDDRAMDILVDLADDDAVKALSEFAMMEPGRVRNPSAFWMGLARKYKGHVRTPGPRIPPDTSYTSFDAAPDYRRIPSSASAPSAFSSALEQRLEELAASGALPRGVLDDRALDALRRLPEHDSIAVLAELPEPARVRNMSAYVMGLCKKFATGEARSLAQRGGSYAGASSSSYAGSNPYQSAYSVGYGAPPPYSGAYGSTTSAPYGAPGYTPGPAAPAYSGYAAPSASIPTSYGSGVAQSTDQARAREVRQSLEAMDPLVRERFYAMTSQGVISETAFDARAIGALQNMRSEEAVAALDELAASEPGRIHNISAYFMGLAKKFSGPPIM